MSPLSLSSGVFYEGKSVSARPRQEAQRALSWMLHHERRSERNTGDSRHFDFVRPTLGHARGQDGEFFQQTTEPGILHPHVRRNVFCVVHQPLHRAGGSR